MSHRTLTQPEAAEWTAAATGHRRVERTRTIGRGDDVWHRAAEDVLHWRVKTRSGFRVPEVRVVVGARPVIRVPRWAPVGVREPVEVVAVVETATRVGFAYRTLPGHPVDGEEAFVVHREGDDVLFTLRSASRAAVTWPWRPLHPLLRIAQAVAHRRYAHALR